MTPETPQPTCPICGQEDCVVNHPDPSHMVTHTEYLADVVEHWKLGYEREKAACERAEAVAEGYCHNLAAAEPARKEAERQRDDNYRRFDGQVDYSITLQRIIEGFAHGRRPSIEDHAKSPHLADVADKALAAAESARAEERRTRDSKWREAVSEELHDIGATQIHSTSLLELFESPPEQDASHVEAGASRGGTSIRIHRASRGSGTSMNDDPKGLMAEQRERLGPLCTHFRYASRCEECGAPPMKAQTDPPPYKPAAGRSADSAATAQDALPGGREAVLREVVALFERDYERVSKLASEWATHDTSDGWGATSQSYQAEQGRAAWAAELVRKLLTVQPPHAAAPPAQVEQGDPSAGPDLVGLLREAQWYLAPHWIEFRSRIDAALASLGRAAAGEKEEGEP